MDPGSEGSAYIRLRPAGDEDFSTTCHARSCDGHPERKTLLIQDVFTYPGIDFIHGRNLTCFNVFS